MPDGQIDHDDAPRPETRREQILDAAAECFRDHGFHGASIARICATANMSPGHVYHYFENKEAIIAAIVERDLDRVLALTAELRVAREPLEALLLASDDGVSEKLDAGSAALRLEIVAEASRNERIAAIVREADRQCLASLVELLRELRVQLGLLVDDGQLGAQAELLAAMFEGLSIRAVRNPALDHTRVKEMFRSVIGRTIAADC
ncbi:MAG: TetR family transcriptional regulator [Rhodocyclaceae bacterium]|nr:TetR family transcriptional regulator [Rhodocyclaceae bacterium]